jgi:cell division protease FtsH
VRTLVESSHQEVTRLLEEHREQLESLAQALLKAETLDAPDAYAAAGLSVPREASPVAVA